MLVPMTAIQMIRELKTLPTKERQKVFAYVDAEIERREDELDRAAVAEARRDKRPLVDWSEAKKRIGLA
jgi:hypothetical protein